jgi:hypothetical protein
MCLQPGKLFAALISVPLLPVVMFYFVGLFGQGIFDRLDEIDTTGRKSAQTHDSLTFRVIICDGQHFAVRTKPVRRPLDHLVRRLARP